MRALTIRIPSMTVEMEVGNKLYEVKSLKSKAPYVIVGNEKVFLTAMEKSKALEMKTAFKGLFTEVQHV